MDCIRLGNHVYPELILAPKLARCQGFRAAFQAVGVNSATRLIGHVPSLGKTSPRYSRNLMPNRRQVSTIEITAAIF
jgi:hypothetical protein